MTEDGQGALPEARTDTLTVAEAADRAGVSPRTMRRWLPKQPLWAVKVEGVWRIRREQFEVWLAEGPRSVTAGRAATSATVTAARAELEEARTEADRARTEAASAREEARQWHEQAHAWQAQAQQLAEALTRLSLPPASEPDADSPAEDTGGQAAEAGERRGFLDWFFGR